MSDSNQYSTQSRGYQLIVTTAVFGGLALASVILRFSARIVSKNQIGLDDWLVASAMFFGIGFMVVSFMLPEFGIGRHYDTIPENELVTMGKLDFAYELLYIPTLSLAKLSILALYRRIFRASNKWFHIAIWVTAVYIVLWSIGIFLAVMLECQPLDSLWDSTCAPPAATNISTGTLNIVSDVAIFIMPLPVIWKLQMATRRKIALSGVFLLGLSATAISIARIPVIMDTGNEGDPDITWSLVVTDSLTNVEPFLAITCSCLPVASVLFRRWGLRIAGLSAVSSLFSRYKSRGSASKESKELRDSEDSARYSDPPLQPGSNINANM